MRLRLAPLAILLGLIAWVAAVSAAQVHPYLDAHYVCAEHGEVVESGHDGKPSATAQVRAADQDAHDHCSLHGVPVAAVSHLVLALPPEPSPVVRDLLLPGAGGPRAPPLAYAPKTSPPALL